jgi:hypothetical protein
VGGLRVGDIGLDNVNPGRQALDLVTDDGPNREPSTDQLFDDRSADRTETGDDVELRL